MYTALLMPIGAVSQVRENMDYLQQRLWWKDGVGSDNLFITSIRTQSNIEIPKDSSWQPLGRKVLMKWKELPPPISTKLTSVQKETFALWIRPLAEAAGALSLRNNSHSYRSGLGAEISGHVSDTWSFRAFGYAQLTALPDWQQEGYNTYGVIPGHAFQQTSSLASMAWGGQVTWRPSKYFAIEGGRDRMFIGDGHRSLLLSDYAPEHPYGLITTSIWRIKYVCLYSFMQDRSFFGNDPLKKHAKYATTHYFAMNLGNRFEIGLFESVVWQGRDTMVRRGYDIHYLNPIIFFRPVEYAMGSADNALVGLNLRYSPIKGLTIYTQLSLDEFYLKEIRADLKYAFNKKDTTLQYGWWANKYAWQFGVKWADPLGVEGLRFAAERNIIRPYMYSHGTVPQNYGHQNHALAHPLGANLKEWILKGEYDFKGFTFRSQLVWYVQGRDTGNVGFGADVFKSYTNRHAEYGNNIGQGNTHKVLWHQLSVSKMLYKPMALEGFAAWTFRNDRSLYGTVVSNYIGVGVRTWMRRQTGDF